MLEAACRVRPLSRAHLGRIRVHMTAAGIRTIPVAGVLFERDRDRVMLYQLPASAFGSATPISIEDGDHGG